MVSPSPVEIPHRASFRNMPCPIVAGLALSVLLAAVSAQDAGKSDCPCIRNGADFGVSGSLKPIISGKTYDYGADYGMASCAAHDATKEPFCDGSGGTTPPAWCEDKWCYVDAGNCKTGLPPGQSQYFKDLFYSYQTCGTQNTFEAWFSSSGSSTTHALPELATVVTNYVTSIVNTLENNEAELRASGASGCSYDATCGCCSCRPESGWGDTPLTFQQTLTLPFQNGNLPGVDACLGDLVGDSFKRIAASEASASRVGFEYYGSTLGSYMQWPGMEDCSSSYDPRFRDWFAGAAAGPKDVVVVIDTSGSMSGDRMRLAQEAATAVVDTLTDADYATIVGFASSPLKMGNTLSQATRAHKQAMRDFISNRLIANGGTGFRGAFDAVEEILSSSTASSGCNRVILFLSDGVPSIWNENDYTSTQARLEQLGNAHLVTYALGSGADSTVLQGAPQTSSCTRLVSPLASCWQ